MMIIGLLFSAQSMYVPTMPDDPLDVFVANIVGGNQGQAAWKDTVWSEQLIELLVCSCYCDCFSLATECPNGHNYLIQNVCRENFHLFNYG